MAVVKRSDAGNGGKRGHSNMSHWDHTAEVKNDARKTRRHNDRATIEEAADDHLIDVIDSIEEQIDLS